MQVFRIIFICFNCRRMLLGARTNKELKNNAFVHLRVVILRYAIV